MGQIISALLLAVPFVGAYAMFALGISVIYRASRVLNLAHGAMAMVPAFAMYWLVQLRVPVPVALVAAVACGAGLGVAVEYVFVRRLRPQGPTAQTVGTVAVTGLLIALAGKVFGTTPLRAPQVFPAFQLSLADLHHSLAATPLAALDLGDAAIRGSDAGLFVTGVAVSLALFAFFRFTDVGLAMRAAAENRRAASLMGVNADLTAVAAWSLGGALAGLAGVLLAASTELDPYNLTFEVLPAFVAVLIGGLDSLPGGLAGSAIAGVTYAMVPELQALPVVGTVFGYNGAPELALAALAMIVMATRGRRFSASDTGEAGLSAGRAPARGTGNRRRLLYGTLALAVVGLPLVAPYSVLGDGLLAVELAVAAISLVVLTGWVGQISLAQATFVGIGALVSGVSVRSFHVDFPYDVLVAAVAAGGSAAILGVVALRVRGLYLAVATLIFAWMGDQFLIPGPWLGAGGGSSTIPAQQLGIPGGFPFIDLTDRRTLVFVMVAILVVVVALMSNVRQTRTGRAFFAVRGSEMAATSLGIDVTRYKLVAFTLAGALAGVAGSLVMLQQRTIVPAQFVITVSLQYLAIAVVGGLGSLGGAIAAALVFAGLEEVFFRVPQLEGWLDVVSAALLAVVLLVYPGGLAAVPDGLARLRGRLAATRGWAAAAAVAGALRDLAAPAAVRAARRRARTRERTDWLAEKRTPAADAAAPLHLAAPEAAADGSESVPPALAGGESIAELAARTPAHDPERRDERPVLLEASGITVRFGGLTAVNGASLRVHEEEIVGLIGPNGAGKTTFFNAILGLNEPAAGTVELYGEDATSFPPHQRARLGVARTFQVIQLFRELTVFENVLVATHMSNRSGLLSNLGASGTTIRSERELRERTRHVLRLLDLQAHADDPVQGLPFGTLRMVELARALVTGSRLVMLDEPASGLNEAETDRMIDVILAVRNLGLSILLIEHDVRMVTRVSDYMYMLDQGRLIAEGRPALVQANPAVIAAYLGQETEAGEETATAVHIVPEREVEAVS